VRYFSAITEKTKTVGESHPVSHVHRVMFRLHLHLIQITFPSCNPRAQSLLSVNLQKVSKQMTYHGYCFQNLFESARRMPSAELGCTEFTRLCSVSQGGAGHAMLR